MTTFREILEMPVRENAEGWVVWLDPFTAVKFKYEEYVALHRMVSNLTPKEVWRQLSAGTFNEYIKHMPDELQELGEGWADELRDRFTHIHALASAQHAVVARLQSVGGEFYSRKDQAHYLKRNVKPELHGLVFALLDGKDIAPAIWRMLEPDGRDKTL